VISVIRARLFYYLSEAKDRLKKIREEQKRCSDEVVELWENVLCDFNYKLGNEGLQAL